VIVSRWREAFRCGRGILVAAVASGSERRRRTTGSCWTTMHDPRGGSEVLFRRKYLDSVSGDHVSPAAGGNWSAAPVEIVNLFFPTQSRRAEMSQRRREEKKKKRDLRTTSGTWRWQYLVIYLSSVFCWNEELGNSRSAILHC
jgi:hypothetical protein